MVSVAYRETILNIENLSVSYGGVPVIKDLCHKIDDIVGQGQIVALLGPSGIGKSTLIRAISGLEESHGECVVTGKVEAWHEKEAGLRPVSRGMVGVVGQKYPLLRHRTVWGNLMIAAQERNGNAKEAPDVRCKKYLEEFHLMDLAGKYPAQLSGGQRQRIATIQQLLRSEHFFILDEPTTGLDPIAKREVLDSIKQFASINELNTIIMSTHDIPAALAVADTIWIMGRQRDSSGQPLPGASIVETIDLNQEGLAWTEDPTSQPGYAALMRRIEKKFHEL